ncbi:hypothetical protein IG631_19106 [Alternaria alternata]|nr:hypothetical protein IG631_19106 [Alternaria alternata]
MTKFRPPCQKSVRAHRHDGYGWVTQQKPLPPSGLGVLALEQTCMAVAVAGRGCRAERGNPSPRLIDNVKSSPT